MGAQRTSRSTVDESLWHRSWASNPANPPTLEDLLIDCASYGFSFVGFKDLPRGRLSMDELEFELPSG